MMKPVVFAAFAGYAAAQQGYGSQASTTYACNPAHQYPAGQVCTTIGGTLTLVTATSAGPASYPTSSCPAPGTAGPDGSYSCNPAHQYPEGQQCVQVDGCYYLVTRGPSVTVHPTTSGHASYPTVSCPAPGTTDSNGGYSCNPAHQYPQGQTCNLSNNGCYILTTVSVGVPASITSSPAAYPTAPCPAPGKTDINGGYSCNPAHQYPEGQKCDLSNGCYILTTVSVGVPASAISSPASSKFVTKVETVLTTYCPQPTTFTHEHKTYTVTKATTLTIPCPGGCTVTKSMPPAYSTPSCPAPGATSSDGCYSCNPAHQYPAGQTCGLVKGCYCLQTPPPPHSTSSCPAPGATGSDGCYSCNPAHQYPAGQTCGLVKGCYCLQTPPKSTNTVVSQPPVYSTKVVTQLTTYCPQPTTFTHEQKTYTITTATTLTLPCSSGCVVTSKVAPPPSYTKPAPPPTKPVGSSPGNTQPSQPPVNKPSLSNTVVTYAVPSLTKPSTSLVMYTGAAAPVKTGIPVIAAMAFGALFL